MMYDLYFCGRCGGDDEACCLYGCLCKQLSSMDFNTVAIVASYLFLDHIPVANIQRPLQTNILVRYWILRQKNTYQLMMLHEDAQSDVDVKSIFGSAQLKVAHSLTLDSIKKQRFFGPVLTARRRISWKKNCFYHTITDVSSQTPLVHLFQKGKTVVVINANTHQQHILIKQSDFDRIRVRGVQLHVAFGANGAKALSDIVDSDEVHTNNMERNRAIAIRSDDVPPPSGTLFQNIRPRWSAIQQGYVLDSLPFNDCVKSSKNFVLVACTDEHKRTVLRFARSSNTNERDEFIMDVMHPFSLVDALSICLTQFILK